MGTIGRTSISNSFTPQRTMTYTMSRRFLMKEFHALVRLTTASDATSLPYTVRAGAQVSGTKTATSTPSWGSHKATEFFDKGEKLSLRISGDSDIYQNSQDGSTNSTKTIYALGTFYPTLHDVTPKNATATSPTTWYEQPPLFAIEYAFEERSGTALNNGGYFQITVSKGGTKIADTGWKQFTSAQITQHTVTMLYSYKEENFPVQFTELVDDPNQIYTWTAQIRVGSGSGYDTSNIAHGSFLYTLQNHKPGAKNIGPTGTILGLNPLISADFRDSSQSVIDTDLHHSMVNYRIQVFNGEDLFADTGTISATSIPDTAYTAGNFPVLFTPLDHAQQYVIRVTTTCDEGYTGFDEATFATVDHQPAVTVTAPSSGTYNLNPQFVALYTDELAHNMIQTLWQVYDGTTLIAETLPGHNSLTPTYNPDNATVWLYAQPLQYGKTYTINFRAQCEVFSWSNISVRTFGINAYTPVATISATKPPAKIDTLNPEFEATYASVLNNSKTHHRFEIWNSTNTTLLGKTDDIASSSTSFSTTYDNVEFTTYSPLSWATTYVLKVFVKDNEDIWNVPVVGSPAYKVFKTNTAPFAPTELSPNDTEITSLIPQLTAKFNDVDSGDTISAMEVEMRKASDNSLVLSRSEAQTTNTFSVFESDNLVIDTSYQWRVRFQDQGNLVGEWSTWATFYTKEGAQVTFTNPEYSELLTTPLQQFSWTYVHPSGIAQSSGRLRIYPATGNIPIYDSGIVAGAYLSQDLPAELLSNNREYRAVVDVIDANGERASTGFVFFRTGWLGPPQPTNITAFPEDSLSYVDIIWDITSVSDFRAYGVYQFDTAEEQDWLLIDYVTNIEQTSIRYYHAPSGRPIRYAVTVLSIIDGALVESDFDSYYEATLNFTDRTWFMDSEEPAAYNFYLMRNPTRDQTYTREAVFTETLGRKHPVVHYGSNYRNEVTVQFQLKMPYYDTIQMINRMIERGKPVLYKDSRGRRMWIALNSYSISDQLPNKATISLSIQRIDFDR